MNLDELGTQLTAAGISHRRRARILAEIADHLSCDPDAKLGDAGTLARQFADELGTFRARRAAFASFAALAVAGGLSIAAVLAGAGARPQSILQATFSAPVALAVLCGVLAGQVALISGGLALIRAFRLRHEAVVVRAEAVLLVRRAGVGLAAGALTMVALAVVGVSVPQVWTGTARVLALIAGGLGLGAIVVAANSVRAASRLRPATQGAAGGLSADLGPVLPQPLQGRPWAFALIAAAAVALAIAAIGALQGDPYDGALRGIADGCACLAGYGLMGRYLGLK